MGLRSIRPALVALVATGAVLLASNAYGQTVDPIGSVAGPLSGFVRDGQAWSYNGGGAQALTVAERARIAAGGGNISRSLTVVGRRVGQYAMRYGGTALLVGSVVYTALDWFYDQAQKATGTSLDDWYAGRGPGSGTVMWGFRIVAGPYSGGALTRVQLLGRYWREVGPYGNQVGPLSSQLFVAGDEPCSTEVCWWDYFGFAEAQQLMAANAGVGGMSPVHADGCLVVGGTSHNFCSFESEGTGELKDWLTANPDAASALGSQVVPEFLENGASHSPGSGQFPYTYAEPYGPGVGVEFDPVPNANQWHDNPYFDPSLDTDGDGWTDSEEATAGTDWMNPDDEPSVSPWPDPAPGEDPAPDADADGIPDALDPCPFHAYNSCAAVEQPEIEFPDDYALEATLSAVKGDTASIRTDATTTAVNTERTADAAEELLEQFPETLPDTAVFTDQAFAAPDLSALEAWSPDLTDAEAAFDAAIADVALEFDAVLVAAEGKFPFGMAALLEPPPVFSATDCVQAGLDVMGVQGTIDLCQSPLDGLMVNTIRPLLAALMTFGLVWVVVNLLVRA